MSRPLDVNIIDVEKPLHQTYLYEFRTEQCQLFLKHKCNKHRPYTCFYWHFMNQRRRRPIKQEDGSFNYHSDVYCMKYDEATGICSNGDSCPLLHRTSGDTERRYHLRYYKTENCVHETDSRGGYCVKNGLHCAFAHGPNDLREPVYGLDELGLDEFVHRAVPREVLLQCLARTTKTGSRPTNGTLKGCLNAGLDTKDGGDFEAAIVDEGVLSLEVLTEIVAAASSQRPSKMITRQLESAEGCVDRSGVEQLINKLQTLDLDQTRERLRALIASTQNQQHQLATPNGSVSGVKLNRMCPTLLLEKDRELQYEDPKWHDGSYVLIHYKTQCCDKPPRLCRQGYACPAYHNDKDRRRSPKIYKYRSTPCPNVKHGDEWGDPNSCENGHECPYCHTRTEQQFHPEIFKTTKCNDMMQTGYCPRGPFCAFAHIDQELCIERKIVCQIMLGLNGMPPSTTCSPVPDPKLQPMVKQSAIVKPNNYHTLESNSSNNHTTNNNSLDYYVRNGGASWSNKSLPSNLLSSSIYGRSAGLGDRYATSYRESLAQYENGLSRSFPPHETLTSIFAHDKLFGTQHDPFNHGGGATDQSTCFPESADRNAYLAPSVGQTRSSFGIQGLDKVGLRQHQPGLGLKRVSAAGDSSFYGPRYCQTAMEKEAVASCNGSNVPRNSRPNFMTGQANGYESQWPFQARQPMAPPVGSSTVNKVVVAFDQYRGPSSEHVPLWLPPPPATDGKEIATTVTNGKNPPVIYENGLRTAPGPNFGSVYGYPPPLAQKNTCLRDEGPSPLTLKGASVGNNIGGGGAGFYSPELSTFLSLFPPTPESQQQRQPEPAMVRKEHVSESALFNEGALGVGLDASAAALNGLSNFRDLIKVSKKLWNGGEGDRENGSFGTIRGAAPAVTTTRSGSGEWNAMSQRFNVIDQLSRSAPYTTALDPSAGGGTKLLSEQERILSNLPLTLIKSHAEKIREYLDKVEQALTQKQASTAVLVDAGLTGAGPLVCKSCHSRAPTRIAIPCGHSLLCDECCSSGAKSFESVHAQDQHCSSCGHRIHEYRQLKDLLLFDPAPERNISGSYYSGSSFLDQQKMGPGVDKIDELSSLLGGTSS